MNANIIPHLSAARMQKYTSKCEGDVDRALELYLTNLSLSSSAYAGLSLFEVLLRNAIDRQLRKWNFEKANTEDWALDPAPLLAGILGNDRLSEAKNDAQKAVGKRNKINHDDVVAQFSLGTWRYLLPSNSDWAKQKLWDEALCDAFPARYENSVATFVGWIEIVYDFRNRVAHHEPIFHLDLHGKRQAIRNVINTISGDARKWFVKNDPFGPNILTFYQEWPEFLPDHRK